MKGLYDLTRYSPEMVGVLEQRDRAEDTVVALEMKIRRMQRKIDELQNGQDDAS